MTPSPLGWGEIKKPSKRLAQRLEAAVAVIATLSHFSPEFHIILSLNHSKHVLCELLLGIWPSLRLLAHSPYSHCFLGLRQAKKKKNERKSRSRPKSLPSLPSNKGTARLWMLLSDVLSSSECFPAKDPRFKCSQLQCVGEHTGNSEPHVRSDRMRIYQETPNHWPPTGWYSTCLQDWLYFSALGAPRLCTRAAGFGQGSPTPESCSTLRLLSGRTMDRDRGGWALARLIVWSGRQRGGPTARQNTNEAVLPQVWGLTFLPNSFRNW